MAVIELLAEAALCHDSLLLRSLAQELLRSQAQLHEIPRPQTSDPRILATSAALLELLALRAGQLAPAWTSEIGAIPEPFFLLEAAAKMKRLRVLCETEAPEPLRKRGLYAPPDFLSFV